MLASPLCDFADGLCPRVTEHDGRDQSPATLDVLDRDALHLAAGQDVEDGGVEERDRLSSREGECHSSTDCRGGCHRADTDSCRDGRGAQLGVQATHDLARRGLGSVPSQASDVVLSQWGLKRESLIEQRERQGRLGWRARGLGAHPL
jgi:hypothetical protein